MTLATTLLLALLGSCEPAAPVWLDEVIGGYSESPVGPMWEIEQVDERERWEA